MQVDEIAKGLSEAQRDIIATGAWQGQSLWHPQIGELNALELLHLDVLKASNGNVLRWKGRLTPLGLAVKARLENPNAS
jgi:hypothetical protein